MSDEKGKSSDKNLPDEKSEDLPVEEEFAAESSIDFPVVGVGASAGGLETFKRLFSNMPTNSGMAFVLVQHLDPNHESIMAELIGKSTEMPVWQVTDEMEIEPDHVYMIPPNSDLVIDDRILRLKEQTKERGIRMPIDSFFRSLARQCRERAICVVLSGTGSDGSLGLKAVKETGGLVIVQDPEEAQYDGMPRAAVGTGMADFVLPVEDIPEKLSKYARHPYIDGEDNAKLFDKDSKDELQQIIALLRERTDRDFRSYKRGTLSRRIARRLSLNHIEDLDQYLEFLRSDKEEVERLFRDLLIGVTAFFRDPEAWEILERKVIYPLVREKPKGETLRIWVAGCSTGEEAYSMAILVREIFADLGRTPDFQIFATDIDDAAIDIARAGTYPKSVGADVSEERLAHFFDAEGNEFTVKKSLRETVVFAPQNLLSDPPFSRLDLVSCRNLLIYLNSGVQQKVIPLFHFSLAREGYLFLGNSESLGKKGDLFKPISKEWRIFKKIPEASDSEPRPDFSHGAERDTPKRSDRLPSKRPKSVADTARDVLLDRFAPASVLIDRKYRIYFFHGPTGRYLNHPTGEPSYDLTVLCDRQLSTKLQSTVHRVASSNESASVLARDIERNGKSYNVRISVERISVNGDDERFLVSFSDEGESSGEGNVAVDQEHTDLVAHLEDELSSTREDLQSGIEELETSNEELKASNEEVMSMNEELQSTNEELETSREELQSLNEELTTVNSELKDKIAELEAANNDLSNLLSSTDIAVIFLDTNFRIRRFTPATSDLISLIPSDVGRPLKDISSRLTDQDLIKHAELVLKKLSPVETEVADDEGNHYIRRVLPYRTQDNYIDGVVITFNDVTELRKAADLVKNREHQQAIVADLGRLALGGGDLDELFTVACRQTTANLGFEYAKVLELVENGKRFLLRAGDGWEEGLVGNEIIDAGRQSQAGFTLESSGPVIVEDLKNEKRFRGPALLLDRDVVSGMSVSIGNEKSPWGVIGVHTTSQRELTVDDIHFLESIANVLTAAIERKEAEERLVQSERRYRLVTDSLPILISYCDRDRRYQFCNAGYEEWFGMEKSNILGKRIEEVVSDAAYQRIKPKLDQAFEGESTVFEEELPYGSGRDRYVRVEYVPDFDGDDVIGVYVMVQDTSSQHEARERLRVFSEELSRTVDERTEELRILNENVPAFFAFLDSDLRYRFVNNFYEEKFNLGAASLIGEHIRDGVSEETYKAMEPLLKTALGGETAESEVLLDIDTDGVRVVRARFVPRRDENDRVVGIFMLADDVTKERELQQEVMTATSLENERIGRDLHDSICQELTGISMLGKALSEKLRRQERGSVEEADELVDQIAGVTHRSRLLARGLSPVALENRTLCEALEELKTSVENLFPNVNCELGECSENIEVDKAISTQLYFITREAVFNAAKHGDDPKVEISVIEDGNYLTVTVRDNGGGRADEIEEGMGIRSMRYRARTFGGSLSIRDRTSVEGLKVVCRLRIRED